MRLLAGLAALAVVAGCGRDSGTEPLPYCDEAATSLLPLAGRARAAGADVLPLSAQASPFDDAFHAAAAAYHVPVALLRAIGWTETRWTMVEGREALGRPAAYGVMALRGERLEAGARLAGVSPDRARHEAFANIRAAAALLDSLATAAGIDRSRATAWDAVVQRFSGIGLPEGSAAYARQVRDARDVGLLRRPDGVLATATAAAASSWQVAGELTAQDCIPRPPNPNVGPDYDAAIWRPSPNYNTRAPGATGVPHMVIIHTCEGAYTGCWSWLANIVSQVSSHYVVDETGSEVSQLVREDDRAWHIAARYRCGLNRFHDCWLNDVQSNHFTIGIEHAGYASQAEVNPGQLEASAALVCDITRDRDIPRDWQHILGHGQLQPENRTDPGESWPWVDYLHRVQADCGETVLDDDGLYNDSAVAAVQVTGSWIASDSTPDYYAAGYRWASADPASDDAVIFSFRLDSAAARTLDARWTAGTNRSPAAAYAVIDAAGDTMATVSLDQAVGSGAWHELGTWSFPAGWNSVALLRASAPGVVVADAVRVRD